VVHKHYIRQDGCCLFTAMAVLLFERAIHCPS
jgi:hypothetical protein